MQDKAYASISWRVNGMALPTDGTLQGEINDDAIPHQPILFSTWILSHHFKRIVGCNRTNISKRALAVAKDAGCYKKKPNSAAADREILPYRSTR